MVQTLGMGRKPLFDRRHVLNVLHDWVVKHGEPPTIQELAKALKVKSTRTAVRYLRLLEEDGSLERRGARGVLLHRMPNQTENTVPVPLIGTIAAGALAVADQNIEAWIRLPKTMAKPAAGKLFLLRVRGNSMNLATLGKERIESGDLVLVRQQATPETGKVVVATVDGDATLKRYVQGPGYGILKPESTEKHHQQVVVRPGFRIQGIVLAILKRGSELLRVEED
jgi:repressor LexA